MPFLYWYFLAIFTQQCFCGEEIFIYKVNMYSNYFKSCDFELHYIETISVDFTTNSTPWLPLVMNRYLRIKSLVFQFLISR